MVRFAVSVVCFVVKFAGVVVVLVWCRVVVLLMRVVLAVCVGVVL